MVISGNNQISIVVNFLIYPLAFNDDETNLQKCAFIVIFQGFSS